MLPQLLKYPQLTFRTMIVFFGEASNDITILYELSIEIFHQLLRRKIAISQIMQKSSAMKGL